MAHLKIQLERLSWSHTSKHFQTFLFVRTKIRVKAANRLKFGFQSKRKRRSSQGFNEDANRYCQMRPSDRSSSAGWNHLACEYVEARWLSAAVPPPPPAGLGTFLLPGPTLVANDDPVRPGFNTIMPNYGFHH